jgi:hypothetical protein
VRLDADDQPFAIVLIDADRQQQAKPKGVHRFTPSPPIKFFVGRCIATDRRRPPVLRRRCQSVADFRRSFANSGPVEGEVGIVRASSAAPNRLRASSALDERDTRTGDREATALPANPLNQASVAPTTSAAIQTAAGT